MSETCPEIPLELTLDYSEQPFIIYDSGFDTTPRIVIFAHIFKKEKFNPRSALLIDGTFKIVPRSFYQLLTIHTIFLNRFYPLIYILLTDKSQSTYELAFRKIQ